MLNTSKIVGLALAGAFAATGASAQTYYGQSHYSNSYAAPSYGTTVYTSPTYQAPTIDLGPIENVQPYVNSTTQYVAPTTTYIQPATTSTYTAPVTSYTTPSYAAQPYYTTPNYSTTYTTPTYTTPTYTTPTYTTPSYVAPAYVPPVYDASARIERRIDRQRSRIRNARKRGDLTQGERQRVRSRMREIRNLYHAYRSNDGVIGRWEEQELMRKLDRQSNRIRRVANNHRVEGQRYYRY